MDMSQYTGYHTYLDTSLFAMTTYERLDGGWDVFVVEPVGAVPELEAVRVDENYIFVGHVPLTVPALEEIQQIAERLRLGEGQEFTVIPSETQQIAYDIEERLWEDYHLVVFYGEMGERRIIQRILEHLRHRGAHGMQVGSDGHNYWQLRIRKKDVPIASEFITSNVLPD
jgi:hypothetical protein